jgi:hypothetical protein
MRSDTVPHHSWNNRSTTHINAEEAIQRIRNGDSRALMSGNQIVGIKDVEPPYLREMTPASITSSEMVTNAMAGIGLAKSKTFGVDDDEKLDEHIAPDFIELAIKKVWAWPGVVDRKSTCVRPRDENLDAKLFAQRKPTPAEKMAAEKRQGAFL